MKNVTKLVILYLFFEKEYDNRFRQANNIRFRILLRLDQTRRLQLTMFFAVTLAFAKAPARTSFAQTTQLRRSFATLLPAKASLQTNKVGLMSSNFDYKFPSEIHTRNKMINRPNNIRKPILLCTHQTSKPILSSIVIPFGI